MLQKETDSHSSVGKLASSDFRLWLERQILKVEFHYVRFHSGLFRKQELDPENTTEGST